MPAASESSLVVVPAKPLRANSGTAEATIAFRLSSLSNRIVAIGAESKRSLTPGQGGVPGNLLPRTPSLLPVGVSGLDGMGRAARRWHHRRSNRPMECRMPQPNDLGRSLVALDQDSTLIAVIEMGQASWLIAAIVPGLNRHPLKKIAADEEQLLQVLRRWKKEAETAGRTIKRTAVAYEAGRDGFWLARWLGARGIEA